MIWFRSLRFAFFVFLAGLGLVTAADLPIRRITLFTSGVGCFERWTEVTDRETAELFFKTDQMMDLIKSLAIVDEGGGTISAVTYDARDPLDRTLRSFAIDLTDNPDLAVLLNRLRGVELRLKTAAGEWAGRVMGVESRTIKEEDAILTEYRLKVFSEGQIRTVPLDQVHFISLVDDKLKTDLTKALETLATGLDRDKKGVRLDFQGKGRRRVRLAYMLEAPVWKTSYRLVLEERNALLQGWAHVENTTDEDWRDVQLTLVSGRPISFIQNLYDPIYLKRPEVQMELYAGVKPHVYEGAMEESEAADIGKQVTDAVTAKGLFMGRAVARQLAAREAPAPSFAIKELESAVHADVEAREVGELFSYSIPQPVTLPRRQSALLPIVNTRLGVEKLSIFNQQVNARYALDAAELTNTTGFFLMQGPITVFDEGVYAGDARLSDTPRGEAKLLSYALDLASDIRVDEESAPEEIVSVKIVNGVLYAQRRYERRTDYNVKNKRERARRYLIEHPIRSGWDLVEPSKNIEKTRDLYRYRFDVGAGKTQKTPFIEQRITDERFGLLDLRDDRVEFYLKQRRISAGARKALETLMQKQRALAEVRTQRENRERRVREITDEQSRIRENMRSVIRPSDSYTMWESKLMKQEKELESLRDEIEKLRDEEAKKEKEIRDYVSQLNVD